MSFAISGPNDAAHNINANCIEAIHQLDTGPKLTEKHVKNSAERKVFFLFLPETVLPRPRRLL